MKMIQVQADAAAGTVAKRAAVVIRIIGVAVLFIRGTLSHRCLTAIGCIAAGNQ